MSELKTQNLDQRSAHPNLMREQGRSFQETVSKNEKSPIVDDRVDSSRGLRRLNPDACSLLELKRKQIGVAYVEPQANRPG